MLSWNTWHLVNISYFIHTVNTNEDNFLWPIAFCSHPLRLATHRVRMQHGEELWADEELHGAETHQQQRELDLENREWGRTQLSRRKSRQGRPQGVPGKLAPGGNILIHLHLYFKRAPISSTIYNPQIYFFVSVKYCIKLKLLFILRKWTQ